MWGVIIVMIMDPDDSQHVMKAHHTTAQGSVLAALFSHTFFVLPTLSDRHWQHHHTTEKTLRYRGVNGLKMAPLINNRVGLGTLVFLYLK